MLEESKLVFIISQPRSGSTMLQKLLSNNEEVDTVSEPWLLLPFLSIHRPELIQATYNFDVMATGVKDYLSKKKLEHTFNSKLKEMILTLYHVSKEGQYFLDKTPRYYEILPEIFSLFPNARYLVLKRNPFASLSSMLQTWSGGRIKFESIKAYYRDFLVAPFKIQEFVESHISQPNVFIVKYEELVNSQEVTTQKIYHWLTIPYTEEVLNLTANKKVSGIYGDDVYNRSTFTKITNQNTESWISQCKQEPMKSFFIDYSNYLSPNFLEKYGYEPISWKKSVLKKNRLFKKFISQPNIKLL